MSGILTLAEPDGEFSGDTRPLAEAALQEGRVQGKTISCAESCTGGLVQGALTDIPGSSDVFRGGAVTYCDAIKEKVLGVPRPILETVGAVSRECAQAMAEGVLRLCDSDFAVSTTGVAGPDGGTEEAPVGCVWFGLAVKKSDGSVQSAALRRQFHGDRAEVRRAAVFTALAELLRTERNGLSAAR